MFSIPSSCNKLLSIILTLLFFDSPKFVNHTFQPIMWFGHPESRNQILDLTWLSAIAAITTIPPSKLSESWRATFASSSSSLSHGFWAFPPPRATERQHPSFSLRGPLRQCLQGLFSVSIALGFSLIPFICFDFVFWFYVFLFAIWNAWKVYKNTTFDLGDGGGWIGGALGRPEAKDTVLS